GLARILRSRAATTDWSPLVEIQPSGSRPGFFCVHGGGGNVLIYRDLARHLGSGQPFYGLQSQGLDGKQPLLERIEDMAALYVKEIQRVQPRGPYFLGGYCMGGTIALEMAQQLNAQNEEVALLALFDTLNWSNLSPGSPWKKAVYQVQRLVFHVQNFLLLSFKDRVRFLRAKLDVTRHRSSVWRGMLFGRLTNERSHQTESSQLARIWKTNDRASLDYVARPYPGMITDFRPMKQYARYKEGGLHWDELALDGQEIVTLPVYPAGMLLEPFVRDLAAALRMSIEKAAHVASVEGSRQVSYELSPLRSAMNRGLPGATPAL
ncbi:MAG: alpha/beta fold hydrolase, partial [Terriglobia bacterium]